jgi:DNA-binding MarR family transcriptional regulator
MTTKLNDLQRALLSAAHSREDGNLFPTPQTIVAGADRVKSAVASLIRRKLAARSGDRVTITDAGRAAIGAVEDAARDQDASSLTGTAETNAKGDKTPAAKGGASLGKASASSNGVRSPSSRAGSKTALLIDLLARGGGATLDELTSATGWLPHTVRAALTGLRKKGHAISRSRQEGHSRYHLGA